ncbi:MAG: hemin uptake protein HemP [Proteobacteria bacterium]|nr:hemin uptake protein HemP [Pseudomonadota bacterium]
MEQQNEVLRDSSLADVPRYLSKALFAKGNEIRIDHNGAVYTLRITRSGGLILNK